MKSWVLLVASSLLQVGWLVSLRETHGMTRLAPLAVNALFGFSSTLLLSLSLEGIPMSTAYTVWTGLSIAGIVVADLGFRFGAAPARLACIALILVGAAGLKLAGAANPHGGTAPSASTAPPGSREIHGEFQPP